MKSYFENNKIELGIDEAGRGCLLGPVCIGSVILGNLEDNPCPYEIRDSKKCSPKIRGILREYIETNSIAYSVQLIHEKTIDEINILQATMKGMHKCIEDISEQIKIDTILVDGNYFAPYMDDDFEPINHMCIPKGDNIYSNIAAASILAKEYHDEYIHNLVRDNPELEKYKLLNNKGYGTQDHLNAIQEFGLTKWHRKSFKI